MGQRVMSGLELPIVRPVETALSGALADLGLFADDLAWEPELLAGANAVFSATAGRYAMKSGSALVSASIADFFEIYSCLTQAWAIGSDGLPYEVAVDTPAYTHHTGRKGLMIDPGGMRLNDSRPWSGVTNGTFAGTQLGAVGLFEEPMRIASQGQSWHRAVQNHSWASGTSQCLTIQYEPGTSGEIRVVLLQTTGNNQVRIQGAPGSLAVAASEWGTLDWYKEYALPNGRYLLHIKFTPDATDTGHISFGPNSETSGEDVILYAFQVRDQGFGWIFGDQTQQITQAPTLLSVPDLIEALCTGLDASLMMNFGGVTGVSGANRLIDDSGGIPLRINSSEAQIALAFGAYTSLGDISTPLDGKAVVGVEHGVEASGSFNGGSTVTVSEAAAAWGSNIKMLGMGTSGVCGVLYEAAAWDRQLTDTEMEAVTL